ncbi:porin [Massilia niastensis]|uniref:porin n=1 Tax=Massilia niastensis TaxID=544911 RepID=UPI00035E6CC5|nr:porin [Massilia niastensis]
MSKQIIKAAAILAALQAAPVLAQTQGNVTVFGILDTYLDASRAGGASAERVQSGGISGSRLGFRGSEDLGSGMKAIFMLEAGINVDDGSSGQGGVLFGRQAWVGLSTRAGDLMLGRQYSPNFFTIVTYGLGGGLAWGNASNYFTDVAPLRVNNAISYVSPSVKGFKARVFHALGENASQPGGSHVGDINSASLQYDSGPVSAGFSVETRKTTASNTERFYAGGASYSFGFAKVGVLAQGRRDDTDATESDALEIGVQVPVGRGFLLLDAGRFRHRSVADADATAFSVRYDYNLSKRTMLYGGVAHIRNESRSMFGINGNTGQALAVARDADPRSLILGVRHIF